MAPATALGTNPLENPPHLVEAFGSVGAPRTIRLPNRIGQGQPWATDKKHDDLATQPAPTLHRKANNNRTEHPLWAAVLVFPLDPSGGVSRGHPQNVCHRTRILPSTIPAVDSQSVGLAPRAGAHIATQFRSAFR